MNKLWWWVLVPAGSTASGLGTIVAIRLFAFAAGVSLGDVGLEFALAAGCFVAVNVALAMVSFLVSK